MYHWRCQFSASICSLTGWVLRSLSTNSLNRLTERIRHTQTVLIGRSNLKASLTFKCMTEHLFADFSYSIALDTYLWKQMMQMNRKLIHIWYNVDKKHLLFTKRKCHKFSWLFTASRCSPRRRSICACRIASKVLVSIGRYSLSFGFLKKGFLLGKQCL